MRLTYFRFFPSPPPQTVSVVAFATRRPHISSGPSPAHSAFQTAHIRLADVLYGGPAQQQKQLFSLTKKGNFITIFYYITHPPPDSTTAALDNRVGFFLCQPEPNYD